MLVSPKSCLFSDINHIIPGQPVTRWNTTLSYQKLSRSWNANLGPQEDGASCQHFFVDFGNRYFGFWGGALLHSWGKFMYPNCLYPNIRLNVWKAASVPHPNPSYSTFIVYATCQWLCLQTDEKENIRFHSVDARLDSYKTMAGDWGCYMFFLRLFHLETMSNIHELVEVIFLFCFVLCTRRKMNNNVAPSLAKLYLLGQIHYPIPETGMITW